MHSFWSYKIKVISILIFLWVSSCFTLARAQSIKIEVNSDFSETKADIVSLRERGLIIFYPFNKIGLASRFQKWSFTRLDTVFNEVYSVEFQLPSELKFQKSFSDTSYVYFLFSKPKEFRLIKMEINSGEISFINGKLRFDNYIINDFVANENFAVFGGSAPPKQSSLLYKTCLSIACFPLLLFPNFVPEKMGFLIHANFNTKSSRELPLSFKGFSEVKSIVFDKSNINMAVVLNSKKGTKHQVIIEDYKVSGYKNRQIFVKSLDKTHVLQDVVLDNTEYNSKVMLGTFSSNHNNSRQGFYLSNIVLGKQNDIFYRNFVDFKSFFDYLPSSDRSKIKAKVERKKEKKQSFELDYHWKLHNKIYEDTSGYVIVAEAFYPQYHTEYTTTFYYGRLVEFATQIFDGYAYTHGVIASFDKKGNLLWDNSIPIDDIMTLDQNEKVKVLKCRDKFLLLYANNKKICYKYIQKDLPSDAKVVLNKNSDDFETKVLNSKPDVYVWYNNNIVEFVSVQKNQLSEGKGIKSTFILTKIRLEDN